MNQAYIDEANKLATAGAWILLLEISKTGYTTLRYTSDNAAADAMHYSIDWDGHTYYALPFVLEDMHTSLKGELHEYGLRVEEVELAGDIRTMVKATNGLIGGTVKVMVVHSEYLDSLTTPAIEIESEVLGCTVGIDAITFRLGIPNPFKKRIPRDRYVPGYCRHKFGGALCKYQAAGYTLTSNQVVFTAGSSYNTITVGDGRLIASVFEHADGERVCVGNKIVNGDFEEGANGSLSGWSGGSYVSDWDLWGNAADAERRWATSQGTLNKAKYGDRSYYHISSVGNAGIKQTFIVKPSTVYTFSCWVYVEGGGANSLRIMTAINAAYPDITTYPSAGPVQAGVWEKISFTATVGVWNNKDGDGNHVINVYIGGVGASYFDAVSVVEGATAGEYDVYALASDTVFNVSGSQSNDGEMVAYAGASYNVHDTYVRVVPDADFVAEAAGETVVISLGYAGCDHTLEACKLRDNLVNYGGSPGISGGIYG